MSIIAGCAPVAQLNFKDFFSKKSSAPIHSADPLTPEPVVGIERVKVDPRLEKILQSPVLVSSKQNILVSKTAIDVVNSQRAALVNGNSNIGPRISDQSNVDMDATVGVLVNKILDDGGALDAMEEAAELNLQISESLYIQSINSQLTQVLRAEQALKNFAEVRKIYDEQIAIYKESRPLLDAAVKANVITKTEVLKLEQLKLRGEEQFLIAQNGANSAKIVRTKFQLLDTDKLFKTYSIRWSSLGQNLEQLNLPRLDIISAQASLIDKDIKGIQATFKPRVLMTGSATAIGDDLDNPVGFFGFNITLPIRDGGKRELEIKQKEEQKVALYLQLEEAKRANLLAFKTLQNFNTLYEGRVNLLDTQIENSSNIVDDLELRLRAGTVSIAELATEKMTYFDLRNQRIALENQRMTEILNFYETVEFACDLVNLCTDIEALTKVD